MQGRILLLASINNLPEWKISTEPVDYAFALQEMEARAAQVWRGEAPELIWLLEHPHVYTAGTSAKDSDVLSARCPVVHTGRGGQVTYHGPGQRVVYLVLDLNKRGRDVRAYVQNLESWVIKTLALLGVECSRRDGRVGLWVARSDDVDDKIAAIGVRVKKWVTLHGLAINVDPDLSYYSGIVPCGIRDHGVTSLRQLGQGVSLEELDRALKITFANVFFQS